jgi:hypothetical protein
MKRSGIALVVLTIGCGGSGTSHIDGGTSKDGSPAVDGAPGQPDATPLPPPTGDLQWGEVIAGPNIDQVSAIATDSAGDVYVVGFFGTSESLPDGTMLMSSQSRSSYVLKLDPTGTVLWKKTFGGTGFQMATCVATFGTKVIVGGNYDADIDLGGGSIAGAMFASTYVVELDGAQGDYVWGTMFANGGGTTHNAPTTLAAAADGSAVIGGTFTVSMTAGTTTLNAAAGTTSGYVVKLDPTGHPVWAHDLVGRMAGTPMGMQTVTGVAIGPSGAVAAVGTVVYSADFGGGPTTSPGDANGDIAVGLFDQAGSITKVTQLGDTDIQRGDAVTFDNSGKLVIVGDIRGTVGPVSSPSLVGLGVFVLDPTNLSILSGTKFVSTCTGCSDGAQGTSIAVDSTGDFVIGGAFNGSLPVGATMLTSTGDEDALVIKLDSTLTPRWAKSMGGAIMVSGQGIVSVAIGATASVVLGGSFDASIVFDATHMGTGIANEDGFVAQLAR